MNGKYRIEIDGTGTFNEGDASKDAMAIAKDCLKKLTDGGQKVSKAHFSHYEVSDLTTGEVVHATPSSVTSTDKSSVSDDAPSSQDKAVARSLGVK